MAGLPNFKPTVKGNRPYFEAKIKDGALTSVLTPTGTPSSAAYATATVSLATLAGYVMQLVTDLKTRGVIK